LILGSLKRDGQACSVGLGHVGETEERLQTPTIHAHQLEHGAMLGVATRVGNAEEKYPLPIAGNLRLVDAKATGRDVHFLASRRVIAAQHAR